MLEEPDLLFLLTDITERSVKFHLNKVLDTLIMESIITGKNSCLASVLPYLNTATAEERVIYFSSLPRLYPRGIEVKPYDLNVVKLRLFSDKYTWLYQFLRDIRLSLDHYNYVRAEFNMPDYIVPRALASLVEIVSGMPFLRHILSSKVHPFTFDADAFWRVTSEGAVLELDALDKLSKTQHVLGPERVRSTMFLLQDLEQPQIDMVTTFARDELHMQLDDDGDLIINLSEMSTEQQNRFVEYIEKITTPEQRDTNKERCNIWSELVKRSSSYTLQQQLANASH